MRGAVVATPRRMVPKAVIEQFVERGRKHSPFGESRCEKEMAWAGAKDTYCHDTVSEIMALE